MITKTITAEDLYGVSRSWQSPRNIPDESPERSVGQITTLRFGGQHMYRAHKKMLVDVIFLIGIHTSLEKEIGNIDNPPLGEIMLIQLDSLSFVVFI